LNLIRVMPAKGQDIPMATSIYLAKLIGPVALVVAVALFLNQAGFKAMAQDFLRSPSLLFLSGFLTLVAGLAIVLSHNVWVANWPVLITILGWLATIGGAARILAPAQVKNLGESLLRNPMGMTIAGGFWLVLGALFCFFGYVR
jgi:hypothetical protein